MSRTTGTATEMDRTRRAARVIASAHGLDAREAMTRVRRDHAMLRALLDDVERAGGAVRARRDGALDELLRSVWELHVSFEEHLTMEEALIVPILRKSPAFGELRAAALRVEHEEQRRLILALVDDTERDTLDIDSLVDEAVALVNTCRADMLAEEASLALLEGG